MKKLVGSLWIALSVVAGCQVDIETPRQEDEGFPVLSGPHLGQESPGLIPARFAPFLLTAEDNKHGRLAFTQDGGEVYFSVYLKGEFPQKIMFMRQVDSRWTPPAVAPFSDRYQEGGPIFSPDGRKIFYYSKRPEIEGDAEKKIHDIWFVKRQGEGWSRPRNVGAPINTEMPDVIDGFSSDGSMYLVRVRDRKFYLYHSRESGGVWQEPRIIKCLQYDEDFLRPVDLDSGDDFFIFEVSKQISERLYNAYLYISFRNPDGSWTAPKSMGDMINRGEGRFASFSPDRKYLFFTSCRTGRAEYYWVETQVIDYLRKNDLALVESLAATVMDKGVQAARESYDQLRIQHAGYYQFDEKLFDDVGDELLRGNKDDEAVAIYELNQELFPEPESPSRRLLIALLSGENRELRTMTETYVGQGAVSERELNGLGRFLLRLGRHESAIKLKFMNWLRSSFRIQPRPLRVWQIPTWPRATRSWPPRTTEGPSSSIQKTRGSRSSWLKLRLKTNSP